MQNRRRLLVHFQFQIRLIKDSILVALVSVIIYFLAMRYFFWKFEQFGKLQGLEPNHVFFRFIAEQQRQMVGIFLATSLVVIFAVVSFGLTISNRIVGPFLRLKKHFELKGQGKPVGPLRLRKKDFFFELEDSVNRCLGETQEDSRDVR